MSEHNPRSTKSPAHESRLRRPYRPRACDVCRCLKTRCEPHPNPAIKPCQKCADLGRTCIISPSDRKRKKRTDTRVAELEAKIDTLMGALQASAGQQTQPHDDNTRSNSQQRVPTDLLGHKNCCCGCLSSVPSPSIPPGIGTPSPAQKPGDPIDNQIRESQGDAISRGIVDMESARAAFERYVSELSPVMPMVVFPPRTTMENVRSEKPILFWAIVATSINTIKPDVQPILMQETYRTFGEYIFARRQKSLELVQAMIICCLWYSSPERIEELNVYQLVHSAVIMAIDIGMNKQVPKKKMTFRSIQEATRRIPISFNADGIETRRTWICLYFLSALVSICYKREILLRWNNHTDECLEIMEGSTETVPSDASLLHWLKLGHIMEQVSTHFALDQGSNAFKLEDPRVQYTLKAYEKLLKQWGEGIYKVTSMTIQQKLMRQAAQLVKIHMHEVGIHFELDDIIFRPASGLSAAEIHSGERINSLISCVTSVHKTLDISFSIDIKDAFKIPTIFIARTNYCAVILMRMSVIAFRVKAQVNPIYAPVDLKAEYYIDKLVERIRNVAKMEGGRPFAHIGRLLSTLNDRFMNPEGPRIPFEEAITNLSFPRHVTSTIRELFRRAAQEPIEQDSQCTKNVWFSNSTSNSAESLQPTGSQGQGQDRNRLLPTYDSSTSHDENCFSSMPSTSSNMDTTLDPNELYYLGSLLDNGLLETSSSFDELMGLF
ncbi:uncharacterized protein TRUGW13939_10452 [Talaromyces rugulosus]|uniref:Zn(2)-C6 fungal-type domain-containing protein n=1 Tax=Talaromyces rugulosus TaxID=121627 RepID=A0A7H8RFG9_TALRU|nr:uncharacterized protein TRUGW13939_10452 [Talaromyces rugulosus]QKX63283.1 hypothetical protein TRUGW13939_10452 [Talaromyces rugulosus]